MIYYQCFIYFIIYHIIYLFYLSMWFDRCIKSLYHVFIDCFFILQQKTKYAR